MLCESSQPAANQRNGGGGGESGSGAYRRRRNVLAAAAAAAASDAAGENLYGSMAKIGGWRQPAAAINDGLLLGVAATQQQRISGTIMASA